MSVADVNLNFTILLALNRFLSRNTYTKTFLAARVIHTPIASLVLTFTRNALLLFLLYESHLRAPSTNTTVSVVSSVLYHIFIYTFPTTVVIGDLYCTCVCRLAAPAQVALEA